MTQPNPKDNSSNRVVQAILAQRLSDTTAFISEWNATHAGAPWMAEIDGPIQLIADAYAMELQRVMTGDDGSDEWTDIVRHVRVLTYRSMDQLLELKPDLKEFAYYFDPKNLDQKAHKMLSGAAHQFGISLRQLERVYPPCIQIVAKEEHP